MRKLRTLSVLSSLPLFSLWSLLLPVLPRVCSIETNYYALSATTRVKVKYLGVHCYSSFPRTWQNHTFPWRTFLFERGTGRRKERQRERERTDLREHMNKHLSVYVYSNSVISTVSFVSVSLLIREMIKCPFHLSYSLFLSVHATHRLRLLGWKELWFLFF